MNAVVLLDPAGSGEGLKKSAKELGLAVLAVFTEPLEFYQKEFFLSEELLLKNCDEVLFSKDRETIFKWLQKSHFPIRAVIAGLDSGTELADQIAHHLNLPCNPIESSAARRNKGEMRRLLKRKGLPYPDFALCSSEQEAIDFAESHSFPLVMKPPQGAGTNLVYVCEDLSSLKEAFHKIYGHLDFFREPIAQVVLEEYLFGKEYIVDAFSDGKKVHITDLWLYEKIHSESFKNIYWSAISFPLSDPAFSQLKQKAQNLIQAFDIKKGPAHLEMKDDPKRGFVLIEIAARLPGAGIPEFLKNFSNFDPYRTTIEVFMYGKTAIPEPIVCTKHFAIALCPSLRGGKIKELHGLESIRKLKSYFNLRLRVQKGEVISQTTYLTTTPLVVFLAHENRGQLIKDLEEAHALFQIEFQ